MTVKDVSPTPPAMIPASKPRLIAMTRQSRYVSLQLVNCYQAVVNSGRVPYSKEAPRLKRSIARSILSCMATKDSNDASSCTRAGNDFSEKSSKGCRLGMRNVNNAFNVPEEHCRKGSANVAPSNVADTEHQSSRDLGLFEGMKFQATS